MNFPDLCENFGSEPKQWRFQMSVEVGDHVHRIVLKISNFQENLFSSEDSRLSKNNLIFYLQAPGVPKTG